MTLLSFINLEPLLQPVGIFLAFVFALFLYFRAGRRELFAKEVIFDFAFVSLVAAAVVGRIFDFFLRPDYYNWSIAKLIFFNAYGGISIIGAFSGFLAVGFWFLKERGESKAWQILDLCAAPLSLGVFVVSLINYLEHRGETVYIAGAIFFFLIFFTIKRLEKIKRHAGFFISFFATCVFLFSLIVLLYEEKPTTFNGLSVKLVIALVYLIIALVTWYLISTRQLKHDLKDLFAAFLLAVFKLKRILTSVREADNLARSIVLLPLNLLKLIRFLVLLLIREVFQSLVDVKLAFGFRK